MSAEEAAAMLCSALGLQCQQQPALSAQAEEAAATYQEIAAQNGFLFPSAALTRADAAELLYQASRYPTGV